MLKPVVSKRILWRKFKVFVCSAFVVLMLVLSVGMSACKSCVDFYVATDGNDNNPGTVEKPFATISRARDAIRKKISSGLAALM